MAPAMKIIMRGHTAIDRSGVYVHVYVSELCVHVRAEAVWV